MTRDEAIDKAVLVNPSRTEALKFVDMAVALDILKLDEPKSVHERLDLGVRANLYSENPYSRAIYVRPEYILEVLDRAGLKPVEK